MCTANSYKTSHTCNPDHTHRPNYMRKGTLIRSISIRQQRTPALCVCDGVDRALCRTIRQTRKTLEK